MKNQMNHEIVAKRLRRIEGQVRGIINMIENDKSCEEVLIQIGSVKSALHKAGQLILENHFHNCVIDGIRSGKEKETFERLSSAIEQFSRII